jgi:glycosyltransferase involved in cell wall biosynthesis
MGIKTIRVPILADVEIYESSNNNILPFDKDFLHLIYAGSAGKKDLIFNVIEAVEKINGDGFCVKLHLLGPITSELRKVLSKSLHSHILLYGNLPQKTVPDFLSRADFSVLLRPLKRFSKAGFPTKFVESMNIGLPVIANLTSDLSYYLRDGFNGFIVNGYSVDDLVLVLKKIISADTNHLKIMRQNARHTALDYFDFRLYSDKLNQFLIEVFRE